MINKDGYVYLLASKNNNVIYTGVTSDLKQRIFWHKQKLVQGFTEKYNVYKLVYYECCGSIEAAIAREKQIKAGSRQKKLNLICSLNPAYEDLYDRI